MITKSILLLMAIHFMADQVLQLKSAQIHKAKHIEMLVLHTLIYGITICLFSCFVAVQMKDVHFVWQFTGSVIIVHFVIELFCGHFADILFDKNYKRIAIILFSLEYTLSMVSLILLFNYFLWN